LAGAFIYIQDMRRTSNFRKKGRRCEPVYLNDGFFQKVGAAFTDPEQRFEFPIKPFEFDFTQESKNSIYIGAAILAGGAILTALIIKNK